MTTSNPTLRDLENILIGYSAVIKNDEQRLRNLETEYAKIDARMKLLEETIDLARRCSEMTLGLVGNIENIISQGLTEVYGVPYVFKLEQVREEGRLKGLRPRLSINGDSFDDPTSTYGTGVMSVINVCFKIMILLLSTGTQKVIVFDEPLAGHLNTELQLAAQAFIENICSKTGLQFIATTHLSAPFGTVWKVTKKITKKERRGVSTVTKLIP